MRLLLLTPLLALAACSAGAPPPPPADAGHEVGGDAATLDLGAVEDTARDSGADLGAVDTGAVEDGSGAPDRLEPDAPPTLDAGDVHEVGAVDVVAEDRVIVDVVAPEDRSVPTPDVAPDRPTCTPGATECSNSTTMRACRAGAWTEIPCGRSASGAQEVCTASSRVCGLASPPCTTDTQCGYGYVACVEAVCVWRGPIACVDDLDCRTVYGDTAGFRCVDASFHGEAVRVCQEGSYSPRPCVLDRQCPSGRRCVVGAGLCVR